MYVNRNTVITIVKDHIELDWILFGVSCMKLEVSRNYLPCHNHVQNHCAWISSISGTKSTASELRCGTETKNFDSSASSDKLTRLATFLKPQIFVYRANDFSLTDGFSLRSEDVMEYHAVRFSTSHFSIVEARAFDRKLFFPVSRLRSGAVNEHYF